MSWMIPESIQRKTLSFYLCLSAPTIYDLVKREKKRQREGDKKRRDHISIHSLQFVIRLQIESLPSFFHLSVNTGSIKPSRAHSDLSRHQTFPPFPLILALSLDWSPVIAHTLKIVIIVLSRWITCGGYHCSVNLSLHSLFKWCIGVYWLIFHHRLHSAFFFFFFSGGTNLTDC